MEEPDASRRHQVRGSVSRTSGLAAERDVVGIAAEGCDIVLHPAERGLLIQDAVVPPGMALRVYRRIGKEAKYA
jgi:hypothetical protein